MKKITLNVDDLGLAPAVNEAVCRLAEARRIQSTSLMSLGDLPREDLARLDASGWPRRARLSRRGRQPEAHHRPRLAAPLR